MKTLVNPSPRPVRLVLVDGSTRDVPPWGMVQVDVDVVRREPIAPDKPKRPEGPEAA